MTDLFPDEIDEALWDKACRRADAIRSFLKRNPASATAADVAELAAKIGLSQATAYRLIKLFRAGGTILSLVDRKLRIRATPFSQLTAKPNRIDCILTIDCQATCASGTALPALAQLQP